MTNQETIMVIIGGTDGMEEGLESNMHTQDKKPHQISVVKVSTSF